ncbi:DNA-binding transcriptional regulator, FadR family [Lutimaribacter pacificus]|uniref:Transcriptional regulator, GntR family n=1 Tax=Lutimaribacter pacificus TaxID=391948 RepID=A0A1H0EMV3_9RHOB|nr:FCD domain-containing protein [Lutimaribacter pacificus]SDN83665.1 DNA-binding transcriptional regulator, FadR family [Lutimaribacter pacificus]SHK51158.1 transcriptional regulator, GntR family [Lutimaribacter pacificus]
MGIKGQPLKVNYAYRQIADEIEGQIMDGTLQPGEQLPGETELADLFSVTRSTVREGLRQLESEGLVVRPTPRRLEVATPSIDRLSTRAGRAMTLMKVTFRELWQVALITEPMAAALAAELATPEDIEQLDEIHDRLTRAQDSEADTIAIDTEFHSHIAEIGKNRVLVLAREPVALLLFQGFHRITHKVPQSFGRQIEAHSQVVAAIRDGDAERAREWARRHIEDFWRGIQIAGLEDEPPIARIKRKK